MEQQNIQRNSPFEAFDDNNTDYPIYPCSNIAKRLIKSYDDNIGRTFHRSTPTRWRTPIHKLQIGESFAVPINPSEYRGLYTHTVYVAKQTGKKFKMTTFREVGLYEIARIA